MPNSITINDLISNKRLASLEFQIFNFLRDSKRTAPEIQRSFQGIASIQTVEEITRVSPFFVIEDELITTVSASNQADITYDFNSDSPSSELFLSGKSCEEGNDKTQTGVSLEIGSYELRVKVIIEGVGNWKLNIKKIEVTTLGKEHERVLVGNPIEEEGTYPEQYHLTDLKI